jgi:CheY-like chemotaxis protein
VAAIDNVRKLCVYVDDTLMAGFMGKMVLEELIGKEWDVVYIDNAIEGRNIALSGLYKARQVAMMVLDNDMPHYTGVQIAQERRNLEKDGKAARMPLYLHSSSNDDLKPFHHLFDGILPKPMNMEETAKVLSEKKG